MALYRAINEENSTQGILKRLRQVRKEKKIYVIANLVRVLQERDYKNATLSKKERKCLLETLRRVRSGEKVLASWLPIGYHTARFISLARLLCNQKIRVTKRDARRIKQAVRYYQKCNDWYSKRQLRSLLFTAKSIGLDL